MKVGSLYTGIAGFDLGFERAGFEIAYQCEIDQHASALLARHFPAVKRYADVREVIYPIAPQVNVLIGGFPCQDVSVAGRRAGLAGERSGLWFEFQRIIRESLPAWVVIENVPGLLSSNHGADFQTIIQGLVELGYGVCWRVLDAQFFGIPQRRRRLFIVGSLGNGRCAAILPESESLRGVSTKTAHKRGHAGTIGTGDGQGGQCWGCATRWDDSRTKCPRCGGFPTYVPLITGTLSDGAHHGGGLNGQDAYTGRIIAPPGDVRRLTPLECERVQGFPDGWTSGQLDGHRFRQLANAVAVPVAKSIAMQIAHAEQWGTVTK